MLSFNNSMLSKEEHKLYKITFWDEFKKHMQKHRSASGKKINWLQYRTGLKNIFLRLETDKKGIRICFDIQIKEPSVREIVWEQMGELKKVLRDEMEDEGIWEEHFYNETINDFCRIYWEESSLNYLDLNHRKSIFNFFENKLIRFDRFYDNYKDILINLID